MTMVEPAVPHSHSGKNQKTQGRSRRERRQPDRRQERPALEAHVVLFHGSMIPMNGAILPGSLSPGLHVVVLAAGFSSRLGRPKALARVRSSTLLRRTLALVASFSPARIVVVVPPRAARYRLEARGLKVVFAANPARAAGLSSSVRRGIALARYSPAVLILPVDLAVLNRRDVARLISRWRAAPAPRGCATHRTAGRPRRRAALRSFCRTGSMPGRWR